MIERQILTGLVVSTEYLQKVSSLWQNKFIGSDEIREASRWCLDYFQKYGKSPGRDIENIYFEKLRKKEISEDLGEGIEDILHELSEEYEDNLNASYLFDETEKYFQERHLQLHNEQVAQLLENGNEESLAEAKKLTERFTPIQAANFADLDLSGPEVLLRLENAFIERKTPVIQYPGALGKFWNDQLVRGGFVGILAREKLGKTFLLLDMAMRGVRQRSKIAFFQAGDMSENQQLMRIASFLSKKPTKEKYCGITYTPKLDCIKNQMDDCNKKERESGFGPFSGEEESMIRNEMTAEQLREALLDYEDYQPCRNCKKYASRKWGVPWLEKQEVPGVVSLEEAQRLFQKYFIDKKRYLRLSTYSNGTLSMQMIEETLDRWAREDGFIADAVLIDYADIMKTDRSSDFRHAQNQIWKDGRALSQSKNVLVVLPTQADAMSYKSSFLKLSNFSEDKRKYAHVTAMYGLNQDKEGYSREKEIGIMRINELLVRDGGFDGGNYVNVLQNLTIGRPFLGSYF